ncbi:SDR family NAD(P)-dependent oxidoreductase [Seohaeicola saemankumensis]|uniref:SDR family NAD(P)-dependent oxidoreductase n=1 Tax=Seohaeicola saemankumensis TaxID=481181 RepID=A0ABW3TFX3_9RHOB
MAQFSGKSVLITGASGGLGQQLAVDFAREGAKVALNYLNSWKMAEETASRIEAEGGEAITCRANISSASEVAAMVDRVVAEHGGVDVLINNAGLSLDAPFLELSEDAWDSVVAVNLKGPFLVSQAVGHHMVAAKCGRIVNISATSALQARVGNANYAASKAGLNMLTQCSAWQLNLVRMLTSTLLLWGSWTAIWFVGCFQLMKLHKLKPTFH